MSLITRNNMLRSLRSPMVILALTMASSIAFSQEADSDEQFDDALEELIVTARKRQETLQETPVSISALSANILRLTNTKNLDELQRNVPGLDIQEANKYGGFAIRGVGQRSPHNVRADPGVGVYLDNIFIPRADMQAIDTLNVQVIEVLRGPQGTLFGKNTAGGAILITTQKPYNIFFADVELTAGNFDRADAKLTVNGGIKSDLSGSLVLSTRKRGGYMEDAQTGREYGDEDRNMIVAQLAWTPNDEFLADFIYYRIEQRENITPLNCFLFNENAALTSAISPASDRTYAEECRLSEALADDDKVIMDRSGLRFETYSDLVGLTLSWEGENSIIKSITGWSRQKDLDRDRDSDGTASISILNLNQDIHFLSANGIDVDKQNRSFVSQELQMVGDAFDEQLDYTFGIFYSTESLDDILYGTLLSEWGYVGFPTGSSVVAFTSYFPNFSSLDNTTFAAFSQFNYSLEDVWQFTIGLRYTKEDKEIEIEPYTAQALGLGLLSLEDFYSSREGAFDGSLFTFQAGTSLNDKESWERVSPMATITASATDDLLERLHLDGALAYLLLSEGFKAGGFDDLDNQIQRFDPEVVESIELGLKLDALENRLRLNMSVYYSNYKDIQVQVTRVLGEADVDAFTTNAGEARIKGLEFEFTVLPIKGLTLSITGNIIDPEYTKFFDEEPAKNDMNQFLYDFNGTIVTADSPQCQAALAQGDRCSNLLHQVDRTHEEFAYLPSRSFAFILRYDWQSPIGLLTPVLNGYYRDEIYIGLDASSSDYAESTLPAYSSWATRLQWEPAGFENRMQVALWANNLFDKEYYSYGTIEASSRGSATLTRGLPRTYGIDFSYRYE